MSCALRRPQLGHLRRQVRLELQGQGVVGLVPAPQSAPRHRCGTVDRLHRQLHLVAQPPQPLLTPLLPGRLEELPIFASSIGPLDQVHTLTHFITFTLSSLTCNVFMHGALSVESERSLFRAADDAGAIALALDRRRVLQDPGPVAIELGEHLFQPFLTRRRLF